MRLRLLPVLVLFAAVARLPLSADTYPRQPVDVEHYRFAIRLTDESDRIAGEATVRLRWLASGVQAVTLDLANVTPARAGKGMAVRDVTSGGRTLPAVHASDRLTMRSYLFLRRSTVTL